MFLEVIFEDKIWLIFIIKFFLIQPILKRGTTILLTSIILSFGLQALDFHIQSTHIGLNLPDFCLQHIYSLRFELKLLYPHHEILYNLWVVCAAIHILDSGGHLIIVGRVGWYLIDDLVGHMAISFLRGRAPSDIFIDAKFSDGIGGSGWDKLWNKGALIHGFGSIFLLMKISVLHHLVL